MKLSTSSSRRNSEQDLDCEDDRIESIETDAADANIAAAQEQAVEATIERKLSDVTPQALERTRGAAASATTPSNQLSFVSEDASTKTVQFGPSMSSDEDEAPIPIGQTSHASKAAKNNQGLQVLDASQPIDPSSYDDSLSKQKIKNEQANVVPRVHSEYAAASGTDRDEQHSDHRIPDTTSTATETHSAPETNISHPRVDQDLNLHTPPATPPTRPTETTPTALSSSAVVFDAVSQRVSTLRYTEDTEIFIPEATIVEEESNKDDNIPSAEVVVPEKYSITIAGKKIHAGALLVILVVIVVLVVALSVSLTRSTQLGGTAPPSISRMPSQSPSIRPSSSPSSELYSSLVRTIYGDEINEIEFDRKRKATMEWLERDRANASTSLSEEELRERYALALLYFVSNATHGWYDDINFLSEGHVCTWRIKSSGEKRGVLVCSEDERVLQLALYGNSLEGTLPTELSFLSHLQVLRLDGNRIESTIPDEFGSLTELSELILNSNLLTGSIPQIVNLVNLTTLYLSNNVISGPLVDVTTLQQLRIFRVDGNELSGEIPESFGNISLETFHVNKNRLVGSMDFMCNPLPYDYRMDCDGNSPEVICRCCIGCTIISDKTCEKNEDLASIVISPGNSDDVFSWQLYEVNVDEPIDRLIAAGGNYDADESVSFQLCLVYPGKYYFLTYSNGTSDDSGGAVDASLGRGDLSVGPQNMVTFLLIEDGSLEIVVETPSPTPTDGYLESGYDDDFSYYTPQDQVPAVVSMKSEACFNVVIQIQTDHFGDETSWEIVNTLDGTVFRSVNAGFYEGNTSYVENECLKSDGCYNFTIFDQWSDGICCKSGNGWFNVSANNRFLYQGGNFTHSDTVVIGGSCSSDVPTSGICPENESPINVTIKTGESSWETSWELYDNVTGQIYSMNSDVMDDNSLQATYKCIPESKCMAFAIYDLYGNGFNGSDAFFDVSYSGELVASGAGDYGYQDVSYFGTGCG